MVLKRIDETPLTLFRVGGVIHSTTRNNALFRASSIDEKSEIPSSTVSKKYMKERSNQRP